ncbi:MAG: phosphoribosylformylglycinamidine synthase subunit PurL [Rhizobiales bacterium]|nr:phosphoribosylformylglycinamidine synthase subunit PurL [Hyphomicrobiales bacterium]NRB13797.1 phosphoribosylformylglycinamidine synthase subunit PurL [Hyphomicrobiales bacterium]
MTYNDIITKKVVKDHGLTKDEYSTIVKRLNRAPNLTELGIFSVMWSEHCSYKSSKFWLKKLPTTGECVICGPGENAGIIDIGDNQAVVFKMESHNHPSFIEPYQGAATGVGGIMRDVFTMGARPMANMNALRFGEPSNKKTRMLVNGVVEGVGGYGNCMGVPTVGGELHFDKSYDSNNLVNAMCVGIADADKIFYSAATGVGNPVVYVGSKTGRDGIHGATMASAEFDENTDQKRPTVQVGDPFTEKLLLEACLELMATDSIIAIQDMGAAGLTSSSVEMADKGNVGFYMNLDYVPQREENMTAYEMLLSESQERMLMVIKPGHEDSAKAIFVKWGLDFAVIGETTDTNRLIITHKGESVVDIPVAPLADDSPEYERPWIKTVPPAAITADEVATPLSMNNALLKLLGSANYCSRKWVWEQYDHMVMGDTIARPGGDAAVVRVHDTDKALAISTDVTPRYVYADPVEGGKQAVAETWRNITAVGAQPLAITDCMNFGNPERPEIMGQFVGAIEGMIEACTKLNYPVVSGNVSLYNETSGAGILPTPAIGGVGLLADINKMATLNFKEEGDIILLIGKENGHLGCTAYVEEILGKSIGQAPRVDLDEELKNGNFVRNIIDNEYVNAVHDVSDGGLYMALAEMAMASGLGADIKMADCKLPIHAALFGEDQARYVITVPPGGVATVLKAANELAVTVRLLGTVIGSRLTIDNANPISVSKLKKAHDQWLPNFMNKN